MIGKKMAMASHTTLISPTILDFGNDIIGNICAYLIPCDVFSLCLTNKRFHENTQEDSCVIKIFMKRSLEENLSKVLVNTKVPGFTLQSFKELSKSCSPSAVAISGGTTVKAILGREWCSDIDIYTTRDHATKVRSWIVKHWGQVLISYSKFYVNHAENQSILMVEKYTTMPPNNTKIIDDRSNVCWPFKKNKIYRQSIIVRLGRYYAPYIIKTTDGGCTLPYEPKLGHRKGGDGSLSIDLVVADYGRSVRDMINEFDLSICQNIYDGKSFRVLYPLKTFGRSSSIKRFPQCFWFSRAYMKNLEKLCQIDNILAVKLDDNNSITIRCKGLTLFSPSYDSGGLFTRADADNNTTTFQVQVYCGVDQIHMMRAKVIKHALFITERDMVFDDESTDIYSNALKGHNIIIKKVNRMIKYSNRGINIKGFARFESNITRILPEPNYDTEDDSDYETDDLLSEPNYDQEIDYDTEDYSDYETDDSDD